MKINPSKAYNLLVFVLISFGIIFHFYNLNWGHPYYFHPDERQNIAYPILESKSYFLYDQKNFDIGTFPLIVIKLLFPIVGGFLFGLKDTLFQVIITSRFLTALLSIGASIIVFKIANDYFNKLTGVIALYLMLFFVGNIQYSHFGTVEMWEAFFLALLLLLALKITKKPSIYLGMLTGLITALALSTKILTLVALPAIGLTFFTGIKRDKNIFLHRVLLGLLFCFSTLAFTFAVMPHAFFNFQNAYPSLKFESDVTLGRLPVFYTQGFTNTTPFLFQFTQVYPFLLNPFLASLLIPSFLYVFYKGLKKRAYAYILVSLFFFSIFFFQGYFFAKWTRYYIPTLPFVSLILAIFIDAIYQKLLKIKLFPNLFLGLTLSISFVYALLFFIFVYIMPSTQDESANWAKANIQKDAAIIAEPYDLGIGPFHEVSNRIKFINFYELDNDPMIQAELEQSLNESEYVILTSQRIVRSRTLSPKKFPKSFAFYRSLSDRSLFTMVYKTSCNILCKIVYIGDPIFNIEETASVFDRPIVTIYRKVK